MARLRNDLEGASPLVVITVVVLVAAGVAAVVVMSLVGGTRSAMSLQQVRDGSGTTSFQVTDLHGSFDWAGVTVQFLDAAGVDHADLYLAMPDGAVHVGDHIALRSQPPGGTYLLRIVQGDTELARVAPTF